MAFPTIPTVAASRVLSALATSPSGTHTSPSLSSLTKNAGDLLIAICIIYDGNSTNAEFSAWGGGFTEFGDFASTTTMGIGCAYKWSTGSETGTFTVTSADASTNDSAFFLLSIPGAHATTPPAAGSRASGTTAAADPAAFDPAGWAAEDTLWIAVAGSGEDATTGSYTGVASAPANYGSYADSGISADAAGGVEGAVAFRQLNAASEDVGVFSFDLSNARNAAIVIAVRPIPTTAIAVPSAGIGTASAPVPVVLETLTPDAQAAIASAPVPVIVEAVLPGAAVEIASAPTPVLTISDTEASPSAAATASAPTPALLETLLPAAAVGTASAPIPAVSVGGGGEPTNPFASATIH